MIDPQPPGPGRFTTTQWSLVAAAGEPDNPAAREALAALCRVYWPPIFLFLRRSGADHEQALDLTQGFFTALLEKNFVADARPDRGRFRTFLLAAVKHYAANVRDWEHARKRGGGQAAIPLDGLDADVWKRFEPRHDVTPEREFERQWARTLLDLALERFGEEAAPAGGSARLDRLLPHVLGEAEESYRGLAAEIGISEGAARVAVHRLRARFRAILREEVSRTVEHPSEVEAELQHLSAGIGGRPPRGRG